MHIFHIHMFHMHMHMHMDMCMCMDMCTYKCICMLAVRARWVPFPRCRSLILQRGIWQRRCMRAPLQ